MIKPARQRRPSTVRASHRVLAKTLKLFLERAVTAHELAGTIGVHLVTAQEWARALHSEGVVFIQSWEQDTLGRDATPVYCLGNFPDKARRRLSRADITKRYRQRLKEKQNAV